MVAKDRYGRVPMLEESIIPGLVGLKNIKKMERMNHTKPEETKKIFMREQRL